MPYKWKFTCSFSGCRYNSQNAYYQIAEERPNWVCEVHGAQSTRVTQMRMPVIVNPTTTSFGDEPAVLGLDSRFQPHIFQTSLGTVTFHVYRHPRFRHTDGETLLIVAHGRQDIANRGTRDVLAHYAFMTPIAHSLMRENFRENLEKYAVTFEFLARSGQWHQSFAPNSYIGPHTSVDNIGNIVHVLSSAADYCAVAVFTKMQLNEDCALAYKNDGKVPLGECIENFWNLGYRRFLLMFCRSEWTGAERGAVPSGHEQQYAGFLYSYDDSIRVPIGRWPLLSPSVDGTDPSAPQGSGLMSPARPGSGLMSPARPGSALMSPSRHGSSPVLLPQRGSPLMSPSPHESRHISPARQRPPLMSPRRNSGGGDE